MAEYDWRLYAIMRDAPPRRHAPRKHVTTRTPADTRELDAAERAAVLVSGMCHFGPANRRVVKQHLNTLRD